MHICRRQRRRSASILRRGEGCELYVERPLDDPNSCNERDKRGAAEEHKLPIERCATKKERKWQESPDDHQLPGLDTEIETDQRKREGTRRQAEFLQDIGEAQAVDKTE